MTHVFSKELTGLAVTVEREFFRIERENRWLSSAINAAIAAVAVGIVSQFATESDLLLFACLGSSASSIVFSPVSRTNSLRSIMLAYAAAATVSLVLYPVHEYGRVPMYLQCALAVGASVFLMRVMDAMHPAAVGGALAFIIFERNIASLTLLIAAIIGMLVVVKVLAYIYLEDLEFRHFRKEFRREYYGHEMMVTVTQALGGDESKSP